MANRGPQYSQKERLAILKEGEKTDGKAVCAKYGFSDEAFSCLAV
jgi:hypothetical protein